MNRRWIIQLASLASGIVLFLVAGSAQAGGGPTIHPMKISGTVFQQGISEKTGEDQIEKLKFSDKDFGGGPTSSPPSGPDDDIPF